ncbi:MAG: Cellobiose phosphotransferase system YdjC-like protein [Bacteroidetes bacterium]|jgi:predicted glycoside hydrolase/deacetylase ChbG (UPF0249 family)|nr:Cellobiose phosphotransferase system YdjC-like protein [Bacteroidota bacterium]
MKHLIITADDYGVFPAINQAVIEAAQARKLNSVAALMNYDREDGKSYNSSIENLKLLLDQTSGDIEVGCHLTITSGKPVTGDKMAFACDNEGNFLTYTEMRNYKQPEELKALKEELCEQIKRMEINSFKPKHLTNHHNSLTLFRHHFDIYMEVARLFNLPMRSTVVEPTGKQNFYLKFLNHTLQDDIHAIDRNEMKKFADEINEHFTKNANGIKSPHKVDSRHYGPLNFLPLVRMAELAFVAQKKNQLDSLYQSFNSSEASSLELMLHLAKATGIKVERDNELKYTGIDKSYFDSRAIEFRSIMNYDMSSWNGVEVKGWGQL